MTTKAFSGAAGTGKTTRLLHEVESHLTAEPLSEGQRVLALTFMHGSRFRLIDRLSASSVRRRFDCLTFDRFAWELCRRWRSRLRTMGLCPPVDTISYDATCDAAGKLLRSKDVVRWTTSRYPVLLMDEFQDCASVRLAIAKRLHGNCSMFLAADDFQNLNITTESPAVGWLRELGIVEELTINHRTKVPELLSAAHALRNGGAISDGRAFRLVGLPTAPPAASFVSKTFAGSPPGEIALLSASRPDSSPWVREVFDLVARKQYGGVGPFVISRERTTDEMQSEVLNDLGLAELQTKPVEASLVNKLGRNRLGKQLVRWVEHQRRVCGRTSFGQTEFRMEVQRAVQHVRSIPPVQNGRLGMTIHQAKNREFPIVIVLWPFATPTDPEQARRWLYNAVTRAKKRAIILVQDPKKNRLHQPPFA